MIDVQNETDGLLEKGLDMPSTIDSGFYVGMVEVDQVDDVMSAFQKQYGVQLTRVPCRELIELWVPKPKYADRLIEMRGFVMGYRSAMEEFCRR